MSNYEAPSKPLGLVGVVHVLLLYHTYRKIKDKSLLKALSQQMVEFDEK